MKNVKIDTILLFLLAISFIFIYQYIDFIVNKIDNIKFDFILYILMLLLFSFIEIFFVVSDEDIFKSGSIKGLKEKFTRWCHDNIHSTRLLLIIAMIIAIFTFSYENILKSNQYLNYYFFMTVFTSMTVTSIVIIYVVSNRLGQRDSILEIGSYPKYFFLSLTLVSIPFLYMVSHKDNGVIMIASFAMAIGLYLNIKWIQKGITNKYSLQLLLYEVSLAILLSIFSYIFVPVIKNIGREIVSTGRYIAQDNEKYEQYKNHYTIVVNNLNLINKNLNILKNDIQFIHKNNKKIKYNLLQCINNTNHIIVIFEHTKNELTFENIKLGFFSIRKDMESLKQNYKQLKLSVKSLQHDSVFDSINSSLSQIDTSIENIIVILNIYSK